MYIHNNARNTSNSGSVHEPNLLIQKYTSSFYNKLKKDIKFIQILFPYFDKSSFTFFFSLLLILVFICLNGYFFRSSSPLFIDENVLKLIGLNKFYISNKNRYYQIISATFVHSSIWNLIINVYYLMNIGIIIEQKFGKLKYILLVSLSAISGNIIACITSNCVDIQSGISPILLGFMGLFLQEIIMYYKELSDKLSVIGNFIFSFLSLHIMITIFPYNGNIFGNLAGLFFGFSFPYIFINDLHIRHKKALKITFAILNFLLTTATLICIIIFKC